MEVYLLNAPAAALCQVVRSAVARRCSEAVLALAGGSGAAVAGAAGGGGFTPAAAACTAAVPSE